MKKAVALFLSVLMIFAMFAVSASAAVTYTVSARYASSNDIAANTDYIIPSGITMTVPSDVTLYIPDGSSVTVNEGGVLNVLGTVVVLNGGSLKVDGDVLHGGNVHCEGPTASAAAAVKFPAISSYIAENVINFDVNVTVKYQGSADTTVFKTADMTNGGKVYAQLGSTITIDAEIVQDIYDEKFLTVYSDGVAVDYLKGVCPFVVANSHVITYANVERASDFYKECRILLPIGTGYEVVGRNGEMSDDGTVYVKYGSYFSFKVELDDTFDRSDLTVKVYDGYGFLKFEVPEDGYLANLTELEPDEYGYYRIFIDGEKTVQVEGAVNNDTLGTATNVMDIIRNILNMITSFFKQIAEMLGISI